MDSEIFALPMFLLLSYLLFRRPASTRSRRRPTELNCRIGKTPLRSLALSLTLILPAGATLMAQTLAGAQTRKDDAATSYDGYYGYNLNRPVGRINPLHVYDVSSNSFSLNQAVISIERAPNLDAGHRFGARLDLMYGPATEAGSESPGNELRPQVFRLIMPDLIFLAAAILFFLLSLAYVRGCEKL